MQKLVSISTALCVLAGLYAASLHNYLLFHWLAEGFSIVIACGIFMVAWHTRRLSANHYLLFIGIAYLFIGLLDFVHSLSYAGMNIITGFDANAPTQLWIAARYLQSTTLLAAPLMLHRRVRPGFCFGFYGTIATAVLFAIFHWRIFPDCFLPGSGLTQFKIVSEYIICMILLASGALVIQRREYFDSGLLLKLLMSIAVTVLSELAFTTYANVFGLSNLIGHLLKIVAFYLMYKAVIETGLAKPYDLLFRDLHRQHERFRVTLTSIGDAVIATDIAGRITFINPVAESLTGWKTEEAMGQPLGTVFRIVNERTGQAAQDPVARVLREGRAIALANHTALVSKEGHTIPIEDSAAPNRDSDGRVIGAVLVFHDVTEKRRSEASLRESEEKFRTAFAHAAIGFALKTPDSRIVDANPAFCVLTGYDLEELKPLPLSQLIHPDNMAEIKSQMDRMLAGEITDFVLEGRYVRKDGAQVWVRESVSLMRCDQKAPRWIIVLVEDITERKQSEEALYEQEQRLRLFIEHAPAALAMFDSQMRYLSVSRRWVADYKLEDCDLIGRSHYEVFPEISEYWKKAHHLALAGTAVHVDSERLERADGSVQYVRWEVLPWRDQIGSVAGIVIFTEDTTERKLAEEALRQVNESLEQRVAERTHLAEGRARQLQALAVELIEAEERERRRVAQLLHDDLQQILAAARMQLESACQSRPAEPILTAVEQMLAESITKTRRLSHELSPAVLYHSGLVAALRWLARQMNEQFGLQVELKADGSHLDSIPLKVFLFRAVQELLFNVAKHSEVKNVHVVLSGSDDSFTITVSDQGKGFNPDVLNSSTLLAGFGLLSICERARYIGGDLVIESAPSRGSRFTLTIPSSIVKADELKQKTPDRLKITSAVRRDDTGAGGIRVLFVDDHRVMRQGLIRLMNGQPGVHVVGEAANGREAIERVQQLKPDVVVMDISMPEIDGIEATRHIKALSPEVRVIGLSMIEDEHICHSMRAAGADAFVSKAASSTELLRAIYGIAG